MISVCIPIYNYDVTALVNELDKQGKKANISFEIVLIDDCSSEKFKKLNQAVCSKHTYIELDKNIGRARIRNLFLKYVKYDNLLFLDCDSLIISKSFIAEYLKFINQNEDYNVVCGGSVYDKNPPSANKRLRWKFGIKKESQPANIRSLTPNRGFKTNNYMIKRQVFEIVKFDERLVEYGHEDTLFGYQLQKNNFAVGHIENPVLNWDIEDNAEFLQKTEIGITNLVMILHYVNDDPNFIRNVSLLDYYEKIRSKHFLWFIKLKFIFLGPIIRYFLIKGIANLWLFDFYKLGFLSQHLIGDNTKRG
jgi:glycosyltransferase involved in cell wall biosynthesis